MIEEIKLLGKCLLGQMSNTIIYLSRVVRVVSDTQRGLVIRINTESRTFCKYFTFQSWE